ncbi:MAG: cbb3-type cytochrome oxidase assembly protein CcoS [Flavobacteriaceae bacterium]|nr:cbb3-type cytochrome oxidase assembly protein CcoS [Flavobacteriaceae bacterium]
MEVIYLLIALSLFIALLFLFFFVKAMRGNQFEDTYTPSVRMLFDDELVLNKKTKT